MDDRTAIERCRKGDTEAFRHIVEVYQAHALGHASAIVGNRDDAMDAVHEAFIDAELLTLRHLDGLSYQELAERLEAPTGTIMSRL